MNMHSLVLAPFGAALACVAAGCSGGGHTIAIPTEVVVPMVAGALPADPTDPRWVHVGEFPAALILQDMVEPRLLAPSTKDVRVRALCDGARIAFRLEWEDDTANDLPMPANFVDACAVQMPRRTAPDVPAPQMGETGRPVEITLWRASWQAEVDGRPDTIQSIYPNALPDHYPFEAASLPPGSEDQRAMKERFAPARALGNQMAGPRDQPVEDLVAEGPGTLASAKEAHSSGRGRRTTAGWSVVIVRKLPDGLGPQKRTQVAFAVWQGANQEVGARKMRTGWTPLSIEVTP